MRKVLLLAAGAAAVACSSPTAPIPPVAITVTAAARPTTTFTVTNQTDSAITVVECSGVLGVLYPNSDHVTIAICDPGRSANVTIPPHVSMSGSVSAAAAGSYVIGVKLTDGVTRLSAPFTVP